MENNYTIKNYSTEISIDDYLKDCVNVAEFLECCKVCPNYNKIWSCPPYDFNPADYWRQYKSFYLYGRKLTFSPEMTARHYDKEALEELTDIILKKEKAQMSSELFEMEKEFPGSISLSAGSCMRCGRGGCTRPTGKPCRTPDCLRYSIESLGGNVGLTITKYLNLELLWMEEGKLPDYFILVAGLLKK
ncbi:MAG: DUF2284 domain-containing protein [Lachnospiraceae bacterium]|nr:DUF2284 domain-containing protein [Lachnospiraceae bacterium]